MDLSCRCERQSVDHDWLNGANAQQLEQRRHVGLEFLRMIRSTGRYAVKDGAAAAEKEAQCAPQLEPNQAEACDNQALAGHCHRLRPVTNEQPAGREARKRTAEVRSANRIEGDINAGPTRGQLAHGSNEVTRAIVDRRCPEPLNRVLAQESPTPPLLAGLRDRQIAKYAGVAKASSQHRQMGNARRAVC
jgi:hypothetical protein